MPLYRKTFQTVYHIVIFLMLLKSHHETLKVGRMTNIILFLCVKICSAKILNLSKA